MIVNFATIVAGIAGMAAALELLTGSVGFYTPYLILAPAISLAVWVFLLAKGYGPIERVFSIISITMFVYVVVAFLAKPSPEAIVSGTFWITHDLSPDYLLYSSAIIGATISPYMQFYLTSAIVDKGLRIKDLKDERVGTFLGISFSGLQAFAIVIVTAAVLFPLGIIVDTPRDVALALFPFLGGLTFILFSIGFFSSSITGTGVVVSTTGYAFSEFFGVERGLSKRVHEAFLFYFMFTACFIIGYGVLLLGITPIQAMVYSMLISFILSPLVMFLLLRITNDSEVLGKHANRGFMKYVGWLIFGILIFLDGIMLTSFVIPIG